MISTRGRGFAPPESDLRTSCALANGFAERESVDDAILIDGRMPAGRSCAIGGVGDGPLSRRCHPTVSAVAVPVAAPVAARPSGRVLEWSGDRSANLEEVVSTFLVLTVNGPDRPGLVETLSQVVANHRGSWLESRMARLAGQFAGVLRVSVPDDQVDALNRALRALEIECLTVGVEYSEPEPPPSDARELRLEIIGSDRPGIVHDISQALADRGINVDELRTEIMSAPMSGELLFLANAELMVPADLDLDLLRKDLEALAHELMVDIDLDELA